MFVIFQVSHDQKYKVLEFYILFSECVIEINLRGREMTGCASLFHFQGDLYQFAGWIFAVSGS